MEEGEKSHLAELAAKMFATRQAAGKATMEFYHCAEELGCDEMSILHAWFKAGFDESQCRNMIVTLRKFFSDSLSISDSGQSNGSALKRQERKIRTYIYREAQREAEDLV